MRQVKFYVFILFILFGASTLSAQTYRPIPSVGARWKMEFYDLHLGASCTVTQNYFITTSGDTTIAGLPCIKLRRSQAQYCDWSGPGPCYPTFQPATEGFLHLDTGGRLYEVEASGTMYPILDFSLGVGDTLHTTHPQRGTIDYVVDSIDVVTLMDGIPRQRQYVSAAQFLMTYQKTVWIEGIGDVHHGPLPRAEIDYRLISNCYSEKTHLYQGGLNSVCPVGCELLTDQADAATGTWTVSPNPSQATWRLGRPTSQTQGAVSVQVTDMNGRLQLQKSFAANEEIELQMPAASAGVYFATITDAAGQSGNIKLVKQ